MNAALTNCGLKYYITEHLNNLIDLHLAPEDDEILKLKDNTYILLKDKKIHKDLLDNGFLITVCSSGIGGPAASIAFEKLIKLGAKVFIRVCSAGGRQKNTPIGTPIVINAAYWGEGTSKAYLMAEKEELFFRGERKAILAALDAAVILHGQEAHLF